MKEATKAWETLSSMDTPHFDKDKSLLACVLDPVVEKFLAISEWGDHISPSWFNKLITDTEFAEYLRSRKGIAGVGSLKHAWEKSTWKKREPSCEHFVMKFLRWNKKIEYTRL